MSTGGAGGFSRRAIPDWLSFASWPAPDGWPLRSFTAEPDGAPRGSLLFLGGRGDFVEKYLEAIGHWRGQSWAVAGFDWRGQGGSGRFLADPLVCHSFGLDALRDDLDAYVADWTARSPAPHVAVAHSMGAHLLLRLLAERRARLDAAVLLAPMFGIASRPLPRWALPLASGLARRAGWSERSIYRRRDRHRGITSCPDRHADKLWWKAERPELASGPPSWGWLAAALASIAALDRALADHAPELPLLIIGSRADPIVDMEALQATAARCPSADLHMVDEAGHELLREADRHRLPLMQKIDTFLQRLTPGASR